MSRCFCTEITSFLCVVGTIVERHGTLYARTVCILLLVFRRSFVVKLLIKLIICISSICSIIRILLKRFTETKLLQFLTQSLWVLY